MVNITGTLAEMLSRNQKFTENYQAPPGLKQAISADTSAEKQVIIRPVIISNAGGRVVDEIRTSSVMQTLGSPGTIAVIHHTDCGMTHVTDASVRASLTGFAPEEKENIDKMAFGEILDAEQSIIEDVAILRNSPLIKKTIQIVGLKYDIQTGLLTQIE